MAITVVEFSREGYKIRKIFDKQNQLYSNEIIEFCKLVMERCQKVPKTILILYLFLENSETYIAIVLINDRFVLFVTLIIVGDTY